MILVDDGAEDSVDKVKAVFDVLLELNDMLTSGLGEVGHAATPHVTKVQNVIKHLVEALMKHLVLEQTVLDQLGQKLGVHFHNVVNVFLLTQFD